MIDINAYNRSIDLLRKASSRHGFLASPRSTDNYKRIWTRDSMVCGLAALLSGDEKLILAMEASFKTLFRYQHEHGFIPSNVDTREKKASYGGAVGRADNPAWIVLGLSQFIHFTGERDLLKKFRRKVESCFRLLNAWEYNGKGLVYVPQSGDWADEYFHHGYILFDQLLRVWAMECWGKLVEEDRWMKEAAQIRLVLQRNFWNNQEGDQWYLPQFRHLLDRAPMNFWFMGFNPSRIYQQFDLQANSLALLLGLGDESQNEILVSLLRGLERKMNNMLPSYYPAIQEGDPDMAELQNNYAYRFRNRPFEFHNGASWPVWNGFLVAALVQAREEVLATKITAHIHRANALTKEGFNECFHGESGEPHGVSPCSWSAAGAVIAENYVEGKSLLI